MEEQLFQARTKEAPSTNDTAGNDVMAVFSQVAMKSVPADMSSTGKAPVNPVHPAQVLRKFMAEDVSRALKILANVPVKPVQLFQASLKLVTWLVFDGTVKPVILLPAHAASSEVKEALVVIAENVPVKAAQPLKAFPSVVALLKLERVKLVRPLQFAHVR